MARVLTPTDPLTHEGGNSDYVRRRLANGFPRGDPSGAIASLKDLYFDELSDLYDAEMQMIRTLPRLAEAARAPELREALRKHSDESRLHLERLELIFTHWGERRRAKSCTGLAGIVQEADDRLNQEATDDVRDAAIIGVAQRIEHYEIAAYGCARTYARRLNRPDEARLLQETLDEEGRAVRRLTEMAEAQINEDARSEWSLRDSPQKSEDRCIGVRSSTNESGPGREQMAARGSDESPALREDDQYTPPHGDTLRCFSHRFRLAWSDRQRVEGQPVFHAQAVHDLPAQYSRTNSDSAG